MPFAPRPLTTAPYMILKRPEKPFWEDLKSTFLDSAPSYLSLTQYPLCYADNTEILTQLGYKTAIPSLLKLISPNEEVLTPGYDEDGYDQDHFLQTGMLLSEKEDAFVYELSGRLHFVGLMFCRTPEDTIKKLEKKGFESGPWMLDQAIFSEQGNLRNLMYGQDYPAVTALVSDLLDRVGQVNASLERVDGQSETTSLFLQLMQEFDDHSASVFQTADKKRKPIVI